MRTKAAVALCTLTILLAMTVHAQQATTDASTPDERRAAARELARTIATKLLRAIDFSELERSLGADRSPLGLSGPELVDALLFGSTLVNEQRDMALLTLVTRRAGLMTDTAVALLVRGIPRLDDWTLIGVVLDVASNRDLLSFADLMPVADRLEQTLEDGNSPVGYERCAVSLADASVAVVRRGTPTIDGAAATALAEQLRSIARTARSRPVVTACNAAAHELLAPRRLQIDAPNAAG